MKEIYQKYYTELGEQVQSEVQKASQLLGFLGILIFIALGKLSEIQLEMKIFIFILLIIELIILLYNILGKGYLGLPKTFDKLEVKKNEKDIKKHYEISYKIWKEKHSLNFIAFVGLVLIFVVVVFSIFFL